MPLMEKLNDGVDGSDTFKTSCRRTPGDLALFVLDEVGGSCGVFQMRWLLPIGGYLRVN